MLRIALIVVASAIAEAVLTWWFGALPAVAVNILGGVWILRLRRVHPPRPERLRGVAALLLGSSIGFLAVWGGAAVLRLTATPVVKTPEKPRNPTIEKAELLVNQGRYRQAVQLLEGCATDECTVILMRIAQETGQPEAAPSGDAVDAPP